VILQSSVAREGWGMQHQQLSACFLCGTGWAGDNFRGNNRCLVRGDTSKDTDRTVCRLVFDFSNPNDINADIVIHVATVASSDTLAEFSLAEGEGTTRGVHAPNSDGIRTSELSKLIPSRAQRPLHLNAATRHVLPA
jgi:hypothetical protein